MKNAVTSRVLTNGLRVVVEERRTVPIVAVNIWYNVGSRHERPDQKGLAHLFEHLMFQGSRNVRSGEFSAILESFGARSNATTSLDRTNYFEVVPAHALDTVLWLEADRMGSHVEALDQREFEAQRDVVKNERLQTIVNPPYGEAFGHLLAGVFPPGHPYSIGPIGEMDHLDAATLGDLRDFFDHFYAPNNAVLSIVGDVDTVDAFAKAELYFGGIESGATVTTRPLVTLPPLPESRTKVVQSDVPNVGLYRGWLAPPLSDASLDAMRLAVGVLGGGPESRLGAKLIRETQLAIHAQMSLVDFATGNSLLVGEVILADGADVAQAEALIEEAVRTLADTGPSEEEFETEVAQMERQIVEAAATVDGRADELSRQATLFGDASRADSELDRLHRVRPSDVQEVVRRWIAGQGSMRVLYHPTMTSNTADDTELVSAGEGLR